MCRLPRPRVIYQDLPHHAGRHRQKVIAAVPIRGPRPEQADVGFIHQACSLQSMRTALSAHPPGSQTAQLGFDDAHQFGASLFVAIRESAEMQGHFRLRSGIFLVHVCSVYPHELRLYWRLTG